MLDHAEGAKTIGDVLSAGLALGTIAQFLPQIAAILSITWTVIRISEWAYHKLNGTQKE